MQWLIIQGTSDSDTEAQWNALHSRFNSAFGYPTTDGLTSAYSIPTPSPTGDAVAMPIEDRCLPYLTAAELAALQTDEQMRANGWFPNPMAVTAKKPWWRFLVWWK